MTTVLPSKSQGGSHPRVLKLRPGSPFSQLVRQAYKGVARRAYELEKRYRRGNGEGGKGYHLLH
jgi:hypothetical protein